MQFTYFLLHYISENHVAPKNSINLGIPWHICNYKDSHLYPQLYILALYIETIWILPINYINLGNPWRVGYPWSVRLYPSDQRSFPSLQEDLQGDQIHQVFFFEETIFQLDLNNLKGLSLKLQVAFISQKVGRMPDSKRYALTLYRIRIVRRYRRVSSLKSI